MFFVALCVAAALLAGYVAVEVLVWTLRDGEKNSAGEYISRVPPSYPVIGSLLDLDPATMLERWMTLTKTHGRIVDLYVFGSRYRLISDVAVVREILSKRPKQFSRLKSFLEPFRVIGIPNNLFVAESAMWSRVRRLTAPQFSAKNINIMTSIIAEEAGVMLRGICADGKTTHAGDHLFNIYTSRVIGRVALGVKLSEMSDYFGTEDLFCDSSALLRYTLLRSTYQLPDWTWKYSPYYSSEVEALERNRRFDAKCSEHFRKVRASYQAKKAAKGKGKGADAGGGDADADADTDRHLSFVEILLRESASDAAREAAGAEAADNEITDQEVLENIKLLFIAGAETTAVSLSWACFLLATHPEWVDRIRAEVDEVVGGPCRVLKDNDQKARLSLTAGVVRESIRLYSAAPFLGVQPTDGAKDFVCPSNGLVVKSTDKVFCFIDAAQRDPSVYKNPDEFDPSRWLPEAHTDSDGSGTAKQELANMETNYLAFGAGPRTCPGMGLAFSEAVTATAAIVSHFDVQLACPKEDIKRLLMFTARPDKMPLTFSERKV